MPTLFEHYEPSSILGDTLDPSQYSCQTFSPLSSHVLTSVNISILAGAYQPDILSQTLTCTIRTTSGIPSKPTLTILDTDDVLLSDPAGSLPQVVTFNFAGAITLLANTTYAIVIKSDGLAIIWKTIDDIADHYTRGEPYYTNDDGVSWVAWSSAGHVRDSWFQEYGNTALPAQVTNPDPPNGSVISYATRYLAWDAGAGATSYDVYFGDSYPPPLIEAGYVGGVYYDLIDSLPLTQGVPYYWRIDSVGGAGTTAGEEWSFTTTTAFNETGITIHENNSTVDTSFSINDADPKIGQTFTVGVSDAHSVAGVKLKLGRDLKTQPGNIKIYLRDSTLSTNLASVTYDGNTLPGGVDNTDALGLDYIFEDIVVEFSSPVALSAGVTYSITIEPDTAIPYPGNIFTQDSTGSVYAGGSEFDYDGANWNAYDGDLWFAEFSEPMLTKPYNPAPGIGAAGIDIGLKTLAFKSGGGQTGYYIYYNFGNPSGALYKVGDYVPVGGTAAGVTETFTIPYVSPSFVGLAKGTLYKWRVDAHDDDTSVTGDEWTFTTADRFAPLPSPGPTPWPSPSPGDDPTLTGTDIPLDTNSMTSFHRLVAVGNSTGLAAGTQFWYEAI